MPCIVKKTFEAARESGNFLIAQVKANQQTLLDAIETIAATDDPVDTSLTVDKKRHGRHEQRLVETFDVAGCLGADWEGLINSAVRVTRHTWRKDTKTGLWQQTSETAFYASQIALDAKSLVTPSVSTGASKTVTTTSSTSASSKIKAASETNQGTLPD